MSLEHAARKRKGQRGGGGGQAQTRAQEVINLRAKSRPPLTFLLLSPFPASSPLPPAPPPSTSSHLFSLLGRGGSRQALTHLCRSQLRADSCHHCEWLKTRRGTQLGLNKLVGQAPGAQPQSSQSWGRSYLWPACLLSLPFSGLPGSPLSWLSRTAQSPSLLSLCGISGQLLWPWNQV